MATPAEIQQKIESLPPDEQRKFLDRFQRSSLEAFFDGLATNLYWESMACHWLGLPTEAERVAKATFDAAWYAKAAFVATLAVGVPALIISLVK